MINISSIKLVKNRISDVTHVAFQRRWVMLFFRFMAFTLGGLHTWAAVTSYSMNADGIAYLDIGDAYIRGDWHTAINPVWSPLYSWILGLVMLAVKPSMRWEFPVVHLVNFGIYLGALFCFEFFWRQLRVYQQSKVPQTTKSALVTIPEWAWLGLGYSLFIWTSLNLIEIWAVTPDMLMAAFVYLAAGFIVRIRMRFTSWPTFALLGLVLGLGYLAKAVMLPLGIIFLGVSLLTLENIRQTWPRVLVALFVFLLFSVPFIAIVSQSEGGLTFGDAGKITYVRYVNGLPYPHWQGEPIGYGTPDHPSRKIRDVPPIYEFGSPIGGTYPISHDPSYWYEGVMTQFDGAQQLARLVSSSLFYFDLFFQQQGGLIFGVFILYLIKRHWLIRLPDLIRQWGLVLPALAAFGMYALVYVEGRYIGVFVVILWADLLANIYLSKSDITKRLLPSVSALMILFLLMNIIAFNLKGFNALTTKSNAAGSVSQQAPPPSWPGAVAEELHHLGIQPDDKVAIIGYGFDSFWARLARVKIVAEMLDVDADPFWLGESAIQDEVIETFTQTDAKAIVAESVPSYASLVGWHQVENSNYYIYLIK